VPWQLPLANAQIVSSVCFWRVFGNKPTLLSHITATAPPSSIEWECQTNRHERWLHAAEMARRRSSRQYQASSPHWRVFMDTFLLLACVFLFLGIDQIPEAISDPKPSQTSVFVGFQVGRPRRREEARAGLFVVANPEDPSLTKGWCSTHLKVTRQLALEDSEVVRDFKEPRGRRSANDQNRRRRFSSYLSVQRLVLLSQVSSRGRVVGPRTPLWTRDMHRISDLAPHSILQPLPGICAASNPQPVPSINIPASPTAMSRDRWERRDDESCPGQNLMQLFAVHSAGASARLPEMDDAAQRQTRDARPGEVRCGILVLGRKNGVRHRPPRTDTGPRDRL